MNDVLGAWLEKHERLAAGLLLVAGLLLRLWAAHGTFLNPDEALHFLVANKPSWALAYQASLTTAHPPLLIFILHFWRAFGTSELMLRLPSVIAGTAFCWFLFRWMTLVFGRVARWVGLVFVTFLPPLIALSAEVRQYALLLCFMGAALYLVERAFAEVSAAEMALACVFVCLALLTHYSALWFAAALGAYSLWRLLKGSFPGKLKAVWGGSQVVLLLLFVFLYVTHLAKLNSGAAITSQAWLANSLFHRERQSLLGFVAGRTFGVFQFIFGQLAVGDVAGVLFVAGLVYLVRRRQSWAITVCLALPFVLNCAAAVAGVYPYGGTRHSAFLIPFALAGVSVAIVGVMKANSARALAAALAVVLVSAAFGSPHRPYMTRADQSSANMSRAVTFLRENLPPDSVIVVDDQTSLLAGHYLCRQQPISFDRSVPGFLVFHCSGFRVLSIGPQTPIFTAASFLNPRTWNVMKNALGMKSGASFWVMQAGWDIGLGGQLRNASPLFHDLEVDQFGRNVEIFRLVLSPQGPVVEKSAPRTGTALISRPKGTVRHAGQGA